jgi:repressor LexA
VSDITARQRTILDFIAETVRSRGYPPTVREIGDAVGLTSSSSVHAQLANLERMGYLHKDPTKPRAMTLATEEPRAESAAVPLVGRIAAGSPILASEHVEPASRASPATTSRCAWPGTR